MLNILYIILYISVFCCAYYIICILKEKQMHKILKNKLLGENAKYLSYKKNKKNIIFKDKKKFNLLNKIYLLLVKTGIKNQKYLWWITPQVVMTTCVIIFIISFVIFMPVLKLPILTFLFCTPIATLPIFMLLFFSDIYEENVEKNLISFIIQLKNQAKISNDVIVCLKNTVNYVKKPLNIYIKTFLFEVEQGVNVSNAFYELKEKVSLDRFKQLIGNIESCYINGGSLYNLLEKTQNVFLKIQNERNKRNEDTLSARIVLIILICISIFIYFRFINFNKVNFDIMINNFIGQIILIFNFISIWLMLFLIIYVKKFDK